MIFGLFKKDQSADTIFVNGNIYTQDADLPWAEAVACKDGEIIYVGNSEEAENFRGKDTYTVDLGGKYMLPGLINTHAHPATQVFEDTFIPISESCDMEDIMGMMSDYILNNPNEEVYFGFGFNGDILKDMTQEEAISKLDEVCDHKPILMLSSAENVLWVNNVALQEAQAAAQEEGLMQFTLQYFLQAVAPFDYEEIQNRTINLVSEYCQKGFTSIFNAGCPEFMDNIYQDSVINMCQQDMIKQRNFGSLRITGNTNPKGVINKLTQKKTTTTELDDYAHCNTLKLVVSREDCANISTENLQLLLEEGAHRGFDIHIDVKDHVAFIECMKLIEEVRNAGFRKNIFVVACEKELRKGTEEFSLDDLSMDNVYFSTPTLCEDDKEYSALDRAESVEEIVDRLTIDAAISLGMNEKLGSIEKGKLADFTVFAENPFNITKPSLFKKLSAEMTVVGGSVVYDAEEDNMSEWYDMMSGMQL